MWHFHGSYGFKFPEFPFAFRTCLRGSRSPRMAVPWIVVDQRGRRFMNEYPPAPQDTAARDLDTFDADAVTYPRIPSYLVFDDAARRLGPIADVTVNDPAYVYEWSADNSAEIARGWILQAATIAGLAERIGVSSTGLEGTVAAWNEACASGHDPDFGRLPTSMRSIAAPPFYTVGQRVLDPFGEPIPRLYAAGELGSIYGSIYQLSGNITECFVGGRIAGRNAGAAVPWE
jgi:hypothetical protein